MASLSAFSALKQKCYLNYACHIAEIEKAYDEHFRSLLEQKKNVVEMVTAEFEKLIEHISKTQRHCQEAHTQQHKLCQPNTVISPPPRPPMPSLHHNAQDSIHNNNGDDEMSQSSSSFASNSYHDHDSEYQYDSCLDCNSDSGADDFSETSHESEELPTRTITKNASNALLIGSMEDISNDITTLNTETAMKRIKQRRNQSRQKRMKLFAQCNQCRQTFASFGAFQTHNNVIHNNRRPFECPYSQCDKTYVHWNSFDDHFKRVHEHEINFRCASCKRPFFSQSDCLKHSKNCRNPYWLIPCKLCPKNEMGKLVVFQSNTQWKAHMSEVHDIKQPKVCRFSDKPGLGKRYSDTKRRQQHQQNKRVKRKEEQHECNICMKRFNGKPQLIQHHQVVHEGKRPFQCKFCTKRFSCRSNMKTHAAVSHNDPASALYECNVCQKRFYQRNAWIKHHKQHVR